MSLLQNPAVITTEPGVIPQNYLMEIGMIEAGHTQTMYDNRS